MIPRQRVRILCVDDNPIITENLAAFLTQNGYDVETARNGHTALAKMSRTPYAFGLIITDLRMPGMDGFDLIADARAAGYIGPFVVYSGQIMQGDRHRLASLRVTEVVEKPARNADMLGVIRLALQQ